MILALATYMFIFKERKQYFYLFLLGLLALGILVYWFYLPEKDILIYGVPYIGNFSGTAVSNAPQSITAMITRYWGDERIPLPDIVYKEFPLRTAKGSLTLSAYVLFFEKHGYDVKIEKFNKIVDFVPYLKQNIPLVLPLKLPSDKYALVDHSVLIGILPGKNVLVFHSNLLGNNYEMPFSDFEKSWKNREADRVFLVIRPSPAILTLIKGQNHNQQYPKRLKIMDDPAMRDLGFKIKWTIEQSYDRNAAELWEEIINDPAFKDMRPDGKIMMYVRLAREKAKSGEIDKAIEIVEKYALPLNHDLERPYGEWPAFEFLPPGAQWGLPWEELGDFYLMKNDFKKAEEAFIKASALSPQNALVHDKLQNLQSRENSFK